MPDTARVQLALLIADSGRPVIVAEPRSHGIKRLALLRILARQMPGHE